MGTPKLKILKASAGSGKTYQLVVEYLKLTLLTEDPSVFRRINAMTFTNKASLEMKERILEALITLSAEKNTKHYNSSFLSRKSEELGIPEALIQERSADVLNRILHYYGEFNIQTLDSFTTKVVRTFANDISVSQDFEVELDGDKIAVSVVERIMESIGTDKELTRLLQKYTESNSEEEKNWDISKSILEFVKAIQKEDINKELVRFEDVSDEEIEEVIKNCRQFVRNYENTITEIASNALEVFNKSGFDRNQFSWKGAILNALEKATKDFLTLPFNSYDIKVDDGGSWFKKGQDQDISSFEGEIMDAYRKMKAFILENMPLYQLHTLVLKNIYNIALLKKVKQTYDDIKSDMNIIPMSDFNHLIQDLIENEPAPFIFERLGNRFQHFLLDEFQDTSILQWKNLIPLVENGLGEDKFSLIVGDAKQAIYRWRNGEVDQFISLPKLYNPENNPLTASRSTFFEEMGCSDVLDVNYRSKKAIVEFNNEIFQNLSSILNEEYQEVFSPESLVQKTNSQTDDGYVEARAFNEPVPESYILDCIKSSIDDGYDLKDICVLTRTNKKSAEIAKYLTKEGLKIASTESLWISSDFHVQFITTLFQNILYENDDSIKRLCMDQYLQIFPQEKSTLEVIKEFLYEEEYKDKTYKKVDFKAFMKSLGYDENAYKFPFQSLYEMGEKIIRNFGFNLENNAYLQLLLEQLFQMDQRPNATLLQFVQWYEETGFRKSIQVSESENAVKIVTVHKSKGLQYPVVICPEVKDKLIARDSPVLIPMEEFQPTLPSVLSPINSKLLSNTNYESVKEHEVDKVALDFINTIYVAFTRAVDRLFIGIETKNKGAKAIFNSINEFAVFEDNISTYGAKSKIEKSHDSDESTQLEKTYQTLWFPDISFQADSNLGQEDDTYFDSRKFGNEMHFFLSELGNSENPKECFDRLRLKGVISSEFQDKIWKQFELLILDEEIKQLLLIEGKNEQDILLPDGSSVRPDKLIFQEPNHVIIVDFKTGNPSKSHLKQIENYQTILSQMNYKVSGNLIYTQLGKLVKA